MSIYAVKYYDGVRKPRLSKLGCITLPKYGRIKQGVKTMFSKTKKVRIVISNLIILLLVLFYCGDSHSAKSLAINKYIITLSSDTKIIDGNGVSSATITAKVTDRKKKPAPAVDVKFSIPSGQGTLSSESATTGADGIASITITSTKVGRVYVLAKIDNAKVTGKKLMSIKVRASTILTFTLTLTVNKPTIKADGLSTATVTALLRNDKNNPVPGEAITFEAEHGTITASGVTNSSGIATATITSDTFNGDVTITANSGSLTATTSIKFVPAGLLSLSVSVSPATIPSDGTTTSDITATLTDSTNNPVSGKTINFSNALDSDGDGTISAGDTLDFGTLSATSGVTDVNGQVKGITITAANPGSIVIQADVEGVSANAVLLAVPPAEVKSVDVTSSDSKILVNGGTTTITATFNNITSGTATFVTSLGYFIAPDIASTTAPINGSGVATATLTSANKTGVAEIKVTSIDATTSEKIEGSVFVQIFSSTPKTVEVSASPNNVAINTGTSTITAKVKDKDGNPVAGQLVGFKIVNTPGGTGPNDGSQLSSASAVSDDDGIAEVTFLAGALETPTFNGIRIDAFLTSDTTITGTTFLTVSGRPFFISIAFAEAPSTDTGSSLTLPITALVSDIHGNPVADGTSVSFGVAITRLALAKVSPTGDFSGSKILNSEDINQNGVLDPEEDINNNGVLDFIEDVNGNGQLDSGEDLNGDGKLSSSDTLKNTNVVITKSATTNGGVVNATLLYGLGLMERYQVLISAEAGGIITSQYLVLPHTLRTVVVAGTTDQTKEIPTDQTAFTVSDTKSTAIPPAGPTDLIATIISGGRVALSWTSNSNNETGFEIERSTTSGSGFANIATVGPKTITYIDSTVVVGTIYYYRVRAVNSNGNSSYSNEATTTNPLILPPSGLTVTVTTTNEITLSWTDNGIRY